MGKDDFLQLPHTKSIQRGEDNWSILRQRNSGKKCSMQTFSRQLKFPRKLVEMNFLPFYHREHIPEYWPIRLSFLIEDCDAEICLV
jgi:hypothetical protein